MSQKLLSSAFMIAYIKVELEIFVWFYSLRPS